MSVWLKTFAWLAWQPRQTFEPTNVASMAGDETFAWAAAGGGASGFSGCVVRFSF